MKTFFAAVGVLALTGLLLFLTESRWSLLVLLFLITVFTFEKESGDAA